MPGPFGNEFNSKNSFNNNFNTTNSGNTLNVTPVNVEGNTVNVGNDNTDISHSGNGSLNGSFNTVGSGNTSTSESNDDHTDNSVNNSNNTVNTTWSDDHSISAGDRSYNTGFGGLNGGKISVSGNANIDARSTVVDQSVNQNISSVNFGGIGPQEEGGYGNHGGVDTVSHSSAVVASGDGSMAAGGNVSIDNSIDASTHIGGHNVNIDSTVNTTNNLFSNNTVTSGSYNTDNSHNFDASDSFNAYHTDVDVNHSFNDEVHNVNVNDWNVDANVIWGGIGDHIDDTHVG